MKDKNCFVCGLDLAKNVCKKCGESVCEDCYDAEYSEMCSTCRQEEFGV